MNETLNILKKRYYIIIVNIVLFYSVFFSIFKSRTKLNISLDQLTDLKYVKNLALCEANRFIYYGIICAIFLSIVFYLNYCSIKKVKAWSRTGLKQFFKFLVITIISIILWVPIYFLLLLAVGFIFTPSIVIAVPLYYGKENLFIPAIILWIITVIIFIFSLILFSLYMNFWYPQIFLKDKNLFRAFRQASLFVRNHYFKLIPIGLLTLANTFIFFVLTYKGFKLINEGMRVFDGMVIIGLFISAVIATFIQTYSFTYLNKIYNKEKSDNSRDEIKNNEQNTEGRT